MKYFEVNVKWSSGFEHSYCIAGSEKFKQSEEDRLSTFNHVTTFNIQEVDRHRFEEFKQAT